MLATFVILPPQRAAGEDQWPSRPIKIVVPFPPGGNTDTVARLTAAYMQKSLGGATVFVENRSGGGGILGAESVAKAAADGYTICMCSIGAITIAPAVQHLSYDPLTDLVPISLVSTNALVLLVHNSLNANSVQELVALARAEPDRLMYSSGGIGGLLYFAAELFKVRTGIKMTHVPYRGGAPATMALIAGEVQVTFANMSDAIAHIEGGRVRALAVTTAQRSPSLPNLATLSEQGVASYSAESWNALFAPKGTPQVIVDRLAGIAADMAKDSEIENRMTGFGSVAVANTPGEFGRMLRRRNGAMESARRGSRFEIAVETIKPRGTSVANSQTLRG